ncbi:hypothetical protein PO909_019998 [Leuciscus waleckii]
MSTFSVTSVINIGRRDSQAGSLEMEKTEADLRQKAEVALSKSEWQQIQDRVNGVDLQKSRVTSAAEEREAEREALYMRSKEAAAQWTNTIAGQRRVKLEAKGVREAIAEEKRKQQDREEAEYRAQTREEALERARTKQFFQTDRVKGFHSALFLTEVQQERKAQIELKRMQANAIKDDDKEFFAERSRREELAVQQDQQIAQQRRRDRKAISESWKLQCKANEMKKEKKRQEIRREVEEMEQLIDYDLRIQAMKECKKQEEKRSSMKAYQDLLTERELMRAAEALMIEEEEEKGKQIISQKEEQRRVWKEKRMEIIRERQRPRDTVVQKLAMQKQQEISHEDSSIAKVVAEREAEHARVQYEKEEKHAAMLDSIAAHRQSKTRELQGKAEEEKHISLETLYALKEADKLFKEKEQLKVQKSREERTALYDSHIQQMAEKRARDLHERKEQNDFAEETMALLVEEENQFQKYASRVIERARMAERNVSPLEKNRQSGRGSGKGAQVFFP